MWGGMKDDKLTTAKSAILKKAALMKAVPIFEMFLFIIVCAATVNGFSRVVDNNMTGWAIVVMATGSLFLFSLLSMNYYVAEWVEEKNKTGQPPDKCTEEQEGHEKLPENISTIMFGVACIILLCLYGVFSSENKINELICHYQALHCNITQQPTPITTGTVNCPASP